MSSIQVPDLEGLNARVGYLDTRNTLRVGFVMLKTSSASVRGFIGRGKLNYQFLKTKCRSEYHKMSLNTNKRSS